MSELFEIYQQSLSNVLKDLNKLSDKLNIVNTDKYNETMKQTDSKLKEADKLVYISN